MCLVLAAICAKNSRCKFKWRTVGPDMVLFFLFFAMLFKRMVIAYSLCPILAPQRGIIYFRFKRLHQPVKFLHGQILWQIAEFIFEDAASASGVDCSFATLAKTFAGLAECCEPLYQVFHIPIMLRVIGNGA